MRRAIALPNANNSEMPIPQGLYKYALYFGADIIGFEGFENYDEVLVFHNKPFGFEIPEKTKVGWYMCDLRHAKMFEPRKFDFIFLCNTEYAQEYETHFNSPVYYMPQTGFSRLFNSNRVIDWDISFIGSVARNDFHNNRADIIDDLKKKFKVKVINGERYTQDAYRIYNHTPINLSISLPVAGYTSNRLYNILSSGGFCLTLYFPEIEKLFDNHKDLVWFKDSQEAVELADYYLKNPDKRKQIAGQGKLCYNKRHRADHRLRNIFDIFAGKTNQFYGYKSDTKQGISIGDDTSV